jgi:hypothetical protein
MTIASELSIFDKTRREPMIESTYRYAVDDEKHIEKIIDDDPWFRSLLPTNKNTNSYPVKSWAIFLTFFIDIIL